MPHVGAVRAHSGLSCRFTTPVTLAAAGFSFPRKRIHHDRLWRQPEAGRDSTRLNEHGIHRDQLAVAITTAL